MIQNQQKHKANIQSPIRKLYSGFSLFGVPYNEIDVRYAAELLYDLHSKNGANDSEAMSLILNQNERVVSRCGMLISFSGTLIALFLFVANRPEVLPMLWQQWVFYSVILAWVISTMHLLWELKHKFPPTWEYHTKYDFMLTAELFLKRMGSYNLALMATIISFMAIAFVLSPISATISDKLFTAQTSTQNTPTPPTATPTTKTPAPAP
jgi:hypothetical protein